MLSEYLTAAMAHAEYEQLPDGSWYGHISGFPGLWANESTPDATMAELRSALEDWLLVTLRSQEHAPIVDGLNLNAVNVWCRVSAPSAGVI